MSHYTCLVIGENPEAQLEPFSENLEVEEYKTSAGNMSTYNPNSKWDWYQLGGRWSGFFKLKAGKEGICGELAEPAKEGTCDQALKGDIEQVKRTYSVLYNGQWYEKGEMGWFGVSHGDKEEEVWDKEFRRLVDSLPDDTLLSLYDLHI